MATHPQEVSVNQSVSSHTVNSSDVLRVMAWRDPVVDAHGHPVNDPYIEMFWLPVLGPTATWLYRRLVSGVLDDNVDFVDVDMTDLARSIGVAHTAGKHNPFARALQRCIMFGVAQTIALHPVHTISVRRCLPALARRHLQRLPEQLQIAHHDWIHLPAATPSPPLSPHATDQLG
jgi:hypothetical protein